MNQNILLNVTQDHINRGKRQDCSACPIALALMDQFPGAEVEVSGVGILIKKRLKDYKKYWSNPETAKFISTFDYGFPVKPFSCKLVEITRFVIN